jgi:hypothetical protein
VLRGVRAGAVKARTAAINQLKAMVVTAPAVVREPLDARSTAQQVAACARLRPDLEQLADPAQATRAALRAVAVRILALEQEIKAADQRLGELVPKAAPRTLGLLAIGIQHAGQLLTTAGDNSERLRGEVSFAHQCGAAPIPASSGRTRRHRLHQAAWDQLVERYGAMVWAVARGHDLALEDAAAVSQVTWLLLTQHLGSLLQPDRLGVWLFTTATREALRMRRLRGAEGPLADEHDGSDPGASDQLLRRLPNDPASPGAGPMPAAPTGRRKQLCRRRTSPAYGGPGPGPARSTHRCCL